MHYCRSNIQHLLIWSPKKDLLDFAINHFQIEFSEHIFVFDIKKVHNLDTLESEADIELKIEDYNFHVVKILDKKVELILSDNTKTIFDNGDLESLLDNIGRIILDFKRKTDD